MTPKIFLIKILQRLQSYYYKFVSLLTLIPKKYFSKFFISFLSKTISLNTTQEKRSKPHILILRNSYYSNKSKQVSTEVFHLDNTLKASGIATFEILSYDDLFLSPICDYQLINKCKGIKPDAIILSSWTNKKANHPSEHAINFIRSHLHIPVASLWWDTCSKSFSVSLKPLLNLFDLHVIMDNPALLCLDKNVSRSNHIITLWPPQDAELFHSQAGSREIPVSFQGQISSYRSYRREVLEFLTQKNIPGKFLTNDRNNQVSHKAYAATMRNSKISINFSQSVDSHQFKSRILEIFFSGSLLLESENEQISQYFKPMIDYVPFSSKEDLVEKINYYLEHEDELKKIANQGLLTALKYYDHTQFWILLLKKLNLV